MFLRKYGFFVGVFGGFFVSMAGAAVIEHIHSEKAVPKAHCVKKKPSPWRGSQIHFGLNISTGNTDSSEIDSKLKLKYTRFPWQNTFKFETRDGRANGIQNKNRYALSNQFKYAFNQSKTQFGFFNVDWIDDAFSPYEYQTVVAAGYGRNLFNTTTFFWQIEVGPGFRYDEVKGASKVQKHWIFTGKTTLEWKVSTYLHFKQVLRCDIGEPFDYIESKTALESKINAHWSMQLAYEIDHFSKIPAFSSNTKKTDTVTVASIVYLF